MRRFTLLVLVAASLVATLPTSSATAADAPTLLGFTSDDDWRTDLDAFNADAGRYPAIFQLFWKASNGWPNAWAAGILDDLESRGMVPYIEWTTDDLASMASGGEDDAISAMVDSISFWLNERDGRHLLVAPLPEANLDEHSWGGQPDLYKQAYGRMRSLFAAGGLTRDKVRFVFAMNGFSSPGHSYRDYYPGDTDVDVVGFARLNRGPNGDGWRDYDDMFTTWIDEMRSQIGTTKPILVTQTGSVTDGGDRGAWFDDMFTGLNAHDQVVGAVYSNRAKIESGTVNDFRVVDASTDMSLDPSFANGYAGWSPPSEASWFFDGRLDAWVTARGGTPSTEPAPLDGGGSSSCPSTGGDGSTPALLGMATASFTEDFPAMESQGGRTPALYQATWPLENTWPRDLETQLDALEDLGMSMYAEITTTDLGALISGGRDAQIDAMLDSIVPWFTAQPGRRLFIAPLPYANVDGQPWGGDPAGYRTAVGRLRQAFYDAGLGDVVTWVFSMNGVSSPGRTYAEFYVDGAFDVVGVGRLNRAEPWMEYDALLDDHLDELKSLTGAQPILLTGVASVKSQGRRAAWFEHAFDCVLQDPQVVGLLYPNRELSGYDYRVVDPSDGIDLDPAFDAAYDTWSPPSELSWFYDGRYESWVADRGGATAFRFADSARSVHRQNIGWLVDAGITVGCGTDAYCPAGKTSRGQIVTFLTRAAGYPATSQDFYTDDDGTIHEDSINRAAAQGVTHACGPDAYCPGDVMLREVMAVLLDQALELPPTGQDFFSDDDGSAFEDEINRVAAAGITLGCGDGRFCPDGTVTRAQMATFLRNGFE